MTSPASADSSGAGAAGPGLHEAPDPPSRSRAHEPSSPGACCTRIENLSARFGATRILEDVNLHLHCGELTVLVGPNGAGKTTLLRAILGEMPHEGKLVFENTLRREPRRPRIGYVPQRPSIDPDAPVSVMDLFACALSWRPVWAGHSAALRHRAVEALGRVEAADLVGRRLGELSGGQLQRVLLALALEPVPNLLLLDEPSAGVDPRGLEAFYGLVSDFRRRYDLSIIMVSHDWAEVAPLADRFVCLNRTILCEGPPARVLAHPAFRKTFGMDAAGGLHLALERRADERNL